MGGTKEGELSRSAELLKQISEEHGLYFVLMFLVDAGYGRDDIKAIAAKLK